MPTAVYRLLHSQHIQADPELLEEHRAKIKRGEIDTQAKVPSRLYQAKGLPNFMPHDDLVQSDINLERKYPDRFKKVRNGKAKPRPKPETDEDDFKEPVNDHPAEDEADRALARRKAKGTEAGKDDPDVDDDDNDDDQDTEDNSGDDLDNLTTAELKQLAEEEEVTLASNARKADIVAAIRAARG